MSNSYFLSNWTGQGRQLGAPTASNLAGWFTPRIPICGSEYNPEKMVVLTDVFLCWYMKFVYDVHIWFSSIIICLQAYDHMREIICDLLTRIWCSHMSKHAYDVHMWTLFPMRWYLYILYWSHTINIHVPVVGCICGSLLEKLWTELRT